MLHFTKLREPRIHFFPVDLQSIILKTLYGCLYNIHDISRTSNLNYKQIKEILSHARIELIDDKYISEEGIRYLADREVGKVKKYFEESIANYTTLSDKERRIFNAFIKRYGIKYRTIKRWNDLKVETIRKDCYNELTGNGVQTFYNGEYICIEEIKKSDDSKSKSVIQLIRSSLMYNMKKMRKWIQFKPSSDTTVAYILTHHFHIFTSDYNNSIHAAKQNTKFYLPQNAKNYILAA